MAAGSTPKVRTYVVRLYERMGLGGWRDNGGTVKIHASDCQQAIIAVCGIKLFDIYILYFDEIILSSFNRITSSIETQIQFKSK